LSGSRAQYTVVSSNNDLHWVNDSVGKQVNVFANFDHPTAVKVGFYDERVRGLIEVLLI
jgi:hypothetical protein